MIFLIMSLAVYNWEQIEFLKIRFFTTLRMTGR
jgi:hypothetical protein